MDIIINNQISSLKNKNVKWYLCDQQLWITKYNEYADVERSIERSVGSFNWLYEINDTVLFNKTDGKFETAIIDLPEKIFIRNMKNIFTIIENTQNGDLYLKYKKNCDFKFPNSVTYDKDCDFLGTYPENLDKRKCQIIFMTEDFGFFTVDQRLEGWILKNASNHVCTSKSNEGKQVANPNLLEKYFIALNIWEENENDKKELENILENVVTNNDTLSLAIKECIINILDL